MPELLAAYLCGSLHVAIHHMSLEAILGREAAKVGALRYTANNEQPQKDPGTNTNSMLQSKQTTPAKASVVPEIPWVGGGVYHAHGSWR